MRHLLANYTGIAAHNLDFKAGPHGKPFLVPPCELAFNLSHTCATGLFAIGRTSAIGIDIETLKLPPKPHELAATVFSTSECASLKQLAGENLTQAFFTCWTRKEAYLKALGVGLIVDPRGVTVGIDPHTALLASCIPDIADPIEVTTFFTDAQFVASLAVVRGFSSLATRNRAPLKLPGTSSSQPTVD